MPSFENTFASLKRNRTFWVGGTFIYTLTAFGSFLYFHRLKKESTLFEPDRSLSSFPAQTTSAIYNVLAPNYDSKIHWDEFMMGLLLLRRWMVSKAEGNVLEIAAGTGRNLGYYALEKVRSLAFLDVSREMLLQLHAKPCAVPYRCYEGVAESLPFGDGAFDSVVSTFSLCSVEDPLRVLVETLRVVKDGGHVHLLEHGQSKYSWLNAAMQRAVHLHAHKFGCWFNRDLETLLHTLHDTPHLHVHIHTRRFHLGTTWMITLTKQPSSPSRARQTGSTWLNN